MPLEEPVVGMFLELAGSMSQLGDTARTLLREAEANTMKLPLTEEQRREVVLAVCSNILRAFEDDISVLLQISHSPDSEVPDLSETSANALSDLTNFEFPGPPLAVSPLIPLKESGIVDSKTFWDLLNTSDS